MDTKYLVAGLCGAAVLAACSMRPLERPATTQQAVQPTPATALLMPPLTLDSYKKEFARRVAGASPDIFDEPMPDMFKSIVVLDIAIDREGNLARVSVRRSNGYKALEARAMQSVQRAAPFGAPAFTLRERDGSVNFLETFLFRDDGRFRILSLVP